MTWLGAMRINCAEAREVRGLIAQAAAEEMLGDARQTLILRLEDWIRTRCGCLAASACSAVLSRKFNEAVMQELQENVGAIELCSTSSRIDFEGSRCPPINGGRQSSLGGGAKKQA